ncbi:hypothetical protein [Lysobacter niastensis]|uniref:Uncharacterized protein n=1 Tax=Lysobacter niastensis TaxID=380629 RepID=A0ABS0BAS0_9GAMM|nr:hypothetical protein [Lysobacter niastensis]MBF6026086.1 hypothetical protein [Lysobacter niastensis]
MTDIVLHDIDQVLLERIGRVAKVRGWNLQEALMHLLEHGLFACESQLAAKFNDSDAMALQAAISALEVVPNDPGFSLIGRIEGDKNEHAGQTQFDLDLLAYLGEGKGQPAG